MRRISNILKWGNNKTTQVLLCCHGSIVVTATLDAIYLLSCSPSFDMQSSNDVQMRAPVFPS